MVMTKTMITTYGLRFNDYLKNEEENDQDHECKTFHIKMDQRLKVTNLPHTN
jgi:hypothetical protein